MHDFGHRRAAQHVIERGALLRLHAGDAYVRATVRVTRDERAGEQSAAADRDHEVLEFGRLEQYLVERPSTVRR